MTDFCRSIIKGVHCIEKISFLLQAGTVNSLDASSEVKAITRDAFSYREVYDAVTAKQEFNIMLSDHSFFQFTEKTENRELRLAYYPNPYRFVEYKELKKEALELLNDGCLTDIEYEQLLSEAEFSCDIPVIRYDLSFRQHCEHYHPTGHLHVGFHSENRWPVDRILSPYAFILKILMYYYPQLWKEKGEELSNCSTNINWLDVEYRKELSSCTKISVVENSKFTTIESERLYII
ncbi:DUF2290 domain-containing protein [Aliivibrio fischeri]|uniref:DUF2290 domain-containing protein n=1 Tax=Aliivibrio fischeri TaxID=668 RepID=UPI0007C55FD2|nr:DUF2290 domain-containing protein [Aliivibrio fischeri]MBP3140109.1 DUF2290 domain-containing protein [Aliivibrio fischeri]